MCPTPGLQHAQEHLAQENSQSACLGWCCCWALFRREWGREGQCRQDRAKICRALVCLGLGHRMPDSRPGTEQLRSFLHGSTALSASEA